MKTKKLLVPALLCLICLATACSHPPAKQAQTLPTEKPVEQNAAVMLKAPPRGAERRLSKEMSEYRAKLLSKLEYDMELSVSGDDSSFDGVETIRFDLAQPQDLTLDFEGGTVPGISINNVYMPSVAYNGHFLTLPAVALKKGSNELKLSFKHPYSDSGKGLYKFKDPEDQKVYLYSNFEPYSAHEMFPCFDQPDLKAKFTLQVRAPSDWHVISTRKEARTSDLGAGRRLWVFPSTPPIATYVFSMHAGPYHVWQAAGPHGIPLRLFARESMAKYVEAPFWFQITKEGLNYYGKEFGVAYPFQKYDQIIVPNFVAGAMENVAAVTFSERLVQRGKPLRIERMHLAVDILHEMAHMWFGDLVTMRWWDDLWLNESFATWASHKAMDAATLFKESWQSFFVEKRLAYGDDLMSTTHPVSGAVNDTDEAFSRFDGITYEKGASTLKQLNFLMGPEAFRDGIKNYFQKYSYGNATVDDFVKSLQSHAKIDLSQWKKEWLESSGLNSVQAQFSCDNGKVTTFELDQAVASGDQILRSHRTQIVFFNRDIYGEYKQSNQWIVSYSGPKTELPQLKDQTCPAVVSVNGGDQDYAEMILDSISKTNLFQGLSKIPDKLARQMFWWSFWDGVRRGEVSLSQYESLLNNHGFKEVDPLVFRQIMASVISWQPSSFALDRVSPPAINAGFWKNFEEMAWNQAENTKNPLERRKTWFDVALDITCEDKAQHLKDVLNKNGYDDWTLDQDRRWHILKALARIGDPQALELRQAEFKKDPSLNGEEAMAEADAFQPSLTTKQTWVERAVRGDDPSMSEAVIKNGLRGVIGFAQDGLVEPLIGTIVAGLPKVSASKDEDYQETFANALLGIDGAGHWIDALKSIPLSTISPALQVAVRKTMQRNEWAKAVRP